MILRNLGSLKFYKQETASLVQKESSYSELTLKKIFLKNTRFLDALLIF